MKLFGKTAAEAGVVHFIASGGIGMSGLAEWLARAGFTVQGSDAGHGYTDTLLASLGVKLFHGHRAAQVAGAALVVLSTAIPATNPELVEAKKRGLKIVHRAEVLAEIMRHYPTIAVAGTHGKTTTTALVYTALKAAGLPVGAIVGGILHDVGSNIVYTANPKAWLVVEADESDASFLKLKPTVALITNIEPEHMDTYGTEDKLVDAFIQFASSADEAIVGVDGLNGQLVQARATPQHGGEVVGYGLDVNSEFGFDAYVTMFTPQGRAMAFDCVLRGGVLDDVVVNATGQHNVLNALGALCVAQLVRADVNKAADGLAQFAGVGRRFSSVGRLGGAKNGPEIIDDYGHHPTEIAATLAAAKASTVGQVVAVIQPHRYTRLRDTLAQFATCAVAAEHVLLLPVHSAGENEIAGINSAVLAEKMLAAGHPSVQLMADAAALKRALLALKLGKSDAVVCLGAGSISSMAKELGKA